MPRVWKELSTPSVQKGYPIFDAEEADPFKITQRLEKSRIVKLSLWREFDNAFEAKNSIFKKWCRNSYFRSNLVEKNGTKHNLCPEKVLFVKQLALSSSMSTCKSFWYRLSRFWREVVLNIPLYLFMRWPLSSVYFESFSRTTKDNGKNGSFVNHQLMKISKE